MTVALYFNHNMPRQIADGLRRRGVDLLVASEDGMARAIDERLLVRATELGRMLVSEDQGFHAIIARWRQAGRDFAGFVSKPHNLRDYGQVIDDLEVIAKLEEPDTVRNQVFYLPL